METNQNFKVGDIVKVMPYEWYDFFKDKDGNVMPENVGVEGARHFFTKDMAKLCSFCLEITDLIDGGYKVYGIDQILEDWMIENKKFNRTQNKIEKSMETKKMKLREAQELVKNTKYIVWSEDESRELQKKLFEIGCKWIHIGKTICNEKHPFLLVDKNLNIRYCEKHNYERFEKEKERFTETHIINIEIEQEPKPKFDPKTLQPFDKVLVRYSKADVWKCSLFSHTANVEDKTVILCTYGSWEFCIPFNDDTKHLLGTTDEAPEYYKLD